MHDLRAHAAAEAEAEHMHHAVVRAIDSLQSAQARLGWGRPRGLISNNKVGRSNRGFLTSSKGWAAFFDHGAMPTKKPPGGAT